MHACTHESLQDQYSPPVPLGQGLDLDHAVCAVAQATVGAVGALGRCCTPRLGTAVVSKVLGAAHARLGGEGRGEREEEQRGWLSSLCCEREPGCAISPPAASQSDRRRHRPPQQPLAGYGRQCKVLALLRKRYAGPQKQEGK